MYLLEMRADAVMLGATRIGSGDIVEVATYTYNTANRWIQLAWEWNYTGINRANLLIDRAPLATDASDVTINRVLAEARLLRAYYYFNLVRLWGDVPLFVAPTSSFDDAFKARTPVAEVYEQIIEDLEYAAGERDTDIRLPEIAEQASDFGRVTLSTAHTMLADVYLTLSDFPKAEEYAKKVMDGGLHDLWENYEDVFNIGNQYESLNGATNAESIFDVAFDPDLDPGSRFVTQSYPRDVILPYAAQTSRRGEGFFEVPASAYNRFDPADLRREVIFPQQYLPGTGTTSGPEPQMNDTIKGGPYDGRLLNREEPFFIMKYSAIDPKNRFGWGANPWPLYRYAEVLLIYAEAINEQRTISQGELDQSINRLRERAGLAPFPPLNQTDMQEAIRNERYAELYFEGKRFFDLVRWGELVEVVNNRNFEYPVGTNINDQFRFLPIPQRDTDANPNLEQNPPWN